MYPKIVIKTTVGAEKQLDQFLDEEEFVLEMESPRSTQKIFFF